MRGVETCSWLVVSEDSVTQALLANSHASKSLSPVSYLTYRQAAEAGLPPSQNPTSWGLPRAPAGTTERWKETSRVSTISRSTDLAVFCMSGGSGSSQPMPVCTICWRRSLYLIVMGDSSPSGS